MSRYSSGQPGRRSADEHVTKQKGECFAATAVYGAEDAQQLQVLRTFRDQTLSNSRLGGAAVHA